MTYNRLLRHITNLLACLIAIWHNLVDVGPVIWVLAKYRRVPCKRPPTYITPTLKKFTIAIVSAHLCPESTLIDI